MCACVRGARASAQPPRTDLPARPLAEERAFRVREPAYAPPTRGGTTTPLSRFSLHVASFLRRRRFPREY
ncbi:hypothetical protein HZH68_001962 [Vespula germanica]|uniref:Uncharacterized protein n=2 Tax=Vespula TaxID=7451 RepID=A0A834KV10_VESGE|nr:hypothetical protein HZH68_001962 [Vespula germanica]